MLQFAITIDVLIAAVSVAVLLAGYIALYERRIWRLDAEIKNLRTLMLLIPEGVGELVPAFGEAMRRLGGGGGAR
jgi:hypothetical protein